MPANFLNSFTTRLSIKFLAMTY